MIEICSDYSEYSEFLLRHENWSFFQTNSFRKHLKSVLKNAQDIFFLHRNNLGEIQGALPAFLHRNNQFGNVLNSLPFYGSNGGIIGNLDESSARELVMAFRDFAKENQCITSTIICSPFEHRHDIYDFDVKDSRIGQLTQLDIPQDTDLEDGLMTMFHYKTRNMIRKAAKNDVIVTEDEDAIGLIFDIHLENMDAIGGLAKPKSFFRMLDSFYEYGTDYKIFKALHNGKTVAALLLFYSNGIVEYFTPVIKAEFRNLQPLSLIILEAMKDAASRNYHWWNWGGTWQSQSGVYQFKKRWGTVDKEYYYYVRIHDDVVKGYTSDQILSEFPYFYVCPFDILNSTDGVS